MKVENDRDYWTIYVDVGLNFQLCPPARIRYHSRSRSFVDFAYIDAEGQEAGLTIQFSAEKLAQHVFDTEEAAWRAYARSDASPLGYLQKYWKGVEDRVRAFRQLALREDLPGHVCTLLLAEVERAERLWVSIPTIEDEE